MIGYVGVVAGIAVLVFLAFKRVNVIVSTCLCAVIIGLTNQMPFVEHFHRLLPALCRNLGVPVFFIVCLFRDLCQGLVRIGFRSGDRL